MLQAPDLKELLRSKGKTQAEVGLHHAYVSQIATGVRRAGAEGISRMAAALGCSTEAVCAACDESYRRANAQSISAPKPDLSEGLARLGDLGPVDQPTSAPSAQGA